LFVFLIKLWVGYSDGFLPVVLKYLLLSGLLGLIFFGVQYWISDGKWIGGGDLRLGVLMGVGLGWEKMLAALVIGYIIGAIVAVILLLLKKKKAKSKLPLGVFLSISSLFVLFWGNYIINWYLSLLV